MNRKRQARALRESSINRAGALAQGIHVGPELLPLLALRVRQPGEAVPGANSLQAAGGPPPLEPLPGVVAGLRVAPGQRLVPPGKILPEPGESLPAPAGPRLGVQPVRVLALTATRQRGGAGGAEAGACRHGFREWRLRVERIGMELRRGGVELLEG